MMTAKRFENGRRLADAMATPPIHKESLWTGRKEVDFHMKKLYIAFSAVFLAVLVLLSSCGSKDRQIPDFQAAPAYEAEDVPLPVPAGNLLGCCTDGESVYILTDEKKGDGIRTVLCRVDLAEGTTEELEGFQAVELPENGYRNILGPILAPDGSLWLYETVFITHYDLPEDYDPEKDDIGKYYPEWKDIHHLRQLDSATGREKKRMDLSDAAQAAEASNVFDVAGFTVDGVGNIYFAGAGRVTVLDKDGNYLFSLEANLPYRYSYNTAGSPLVLLPDGRAALLTSRTDGKRDVRTIDPTAKTWGKERYALPGGVDLIYGGTNGFLFYYISGGALCAWEPEAEEGRPLLNWSAANLDGPVMCFALREEGELAALTLTQKGAFEDENYRYNTDIHLFKLSPTDKNPSEGKIRLVYGSIGTNSVLRSRIKQFNDSNDTYYIELRNYAGEGVETNDVMSNDTRDAALRLLGAEVASGKAPDIWDTSLPKNLYARKGVLEDLWPYIDSDPDIGRDTLMTHVLDCASVDGKLYQVFNSFYIETIAARSEVVGNRTCWTLDEMLDYYEAMPEGSTLLGVGYGKENILYTLVSYTASQWIDWTTGECRFDSKEFKALLELSLRMGQDGFSKAEEPEKWNDRANGVDFREGRQLLYSAMLTGVKDLLCYEALAGGPACIMDYEAYLNKYNIYATPVDDSSLTCQALTQVKFDRQAGKLMGWYPLSPDAVFGAVEGGGYVSYVGAPSSNGAGSCFRLPSWYSLTDCSLGICASSQAKEGAWAYVRQFLLPSGGAEVKADEIIYQGSGFPVNKLDFDSLFEPQWFQRMDKAGNLEYVLDQDGNRIQNPEEITWVPNGYSNVDISMVLYCLAPNEAQMERFWDLYNAIDSMAGNDREIMDILLEEAGPYFAGDKSLDETADLIQSRVSVYVNENR